MQCKNKRRVIKNNKEEILGRRNNPDYSQITGLIPKALAQRFRVYCVEKEIMLTDALEQAILEFLDKRYSPIQEFLDKQHPQDVASVGANRRKRGGKVKKDDEKRSQ